jgi:hypothetical protein
MADRSAQEESHVFRTRDALARFKVIDLIPVSSPKVS